MKPEVFQDILNESNFLNAELIQDNKFHFYHEGSVYRVRMPKQKELSEVNKAKNSFYVELLKTPNALSKDNLKKLLKESQGIDIEAMELELKDLEESLYKVYLDLAGKKDANEEGIQKCKDNVSEINDKRFKLIEKISSYLTPSIEVQIENHYMEQLASICTDKLENSEKEEWKRVWNSFDEFMNDESTLRLYAVSLLAKLMMGVNA